MYAPCRQCGNAMFVGEGNGGSPPACPSCGAGALKPGGARAGGADDLIVVVGLAVGVLALIGAAVLGFVALDYGKNKRTANGVVRTKFTATGGGVNAFSVRGKYQTVISYRVGGKEYEIEGTGKTDGDPVPVYYLPSDPARGTTMSFNAFGALAGGVALIGLFLSGVCGFARWSRAA